MRNLKILGLSLLALVGVMAISASAAQAKWLLLLNGVSVLKEILNVTVNSGELLVPSLGLKIFCSGGTGTAGIELSADHKTLSGSVTGTFNKCKDLEFSEVCTVHGVGDGAETISAKGTGTASMEGEKVLVNAASSEFANVEYLGEECPFVEVDGRVSGSVTLEVLKPLEDANLHQVHLVKQNLLYGTAAAELHNGTKGGLLSGSVTVTGATNKVGLHLVGL
jgi:hypothetical protein